MNSSDPDIARNKAILPTLVAITATLSVIIGKALLINRRMGAPFGNLTRDITAICDLPFYTGFISQVGILLWSASTAICFFGSQIASSRQCGARWQRFFFFSGLLSLLLGIDDAFLLHEEVMPKLGISEKLVFISYACFLLFYLIKFRSIILLKTDNVFLKFSLFFFAVSILLDFLPIEEIDPYLIEDTAKFTGIMLWLAYFWHAAKLALGETLSGDLVVRGFPEKLMKS